MKSPATAASATPKAKSKSTSTSTYSPAAAAAQYIADSKSELAAARTETAESKTQAARAAHSRAEAAADTAKARADAKKGNTAGEKRLLADAARDNARATRDTARSQRDVARAARNTVKAKANAIKAKTVSLALPGAVEDGWILGGNDVHDTCVAAAIANSLLLSRGLRASDGDVAGLHAVIAGVSIPDALDALAATGLGGVVPRGWQPLGQGEPLEDGVIVEFALREPHAAVLNGGGVITWGRAVPVSDAFLDAQAVGAWRVQWPSADGGEP